MSVATLGSLFSGIEGFGLGFERAGFEIVWQVEQDAFCNAVLKTHWPDVRRYGRIEDCCGVYKPNERRFRSGKTAHHCQRTHHLWWVDCITAGVPCQDVSVAGQRKGLSGERTGLFYEFARILQELRPTWFVFENVPGLFSSNQGRDFAEVLRVLMVECGYGVSWRMLDSRYFNVAQRRERVFIVGCFGKPCPPEILFESQSGERDFAAIRETRKDIAVPLTSGSGVTSNGSGRRCEDDFNLVVGPLKATDDHRINAEAALNLQVARPLRINERNNSDGRSVNLAYALREDPGGTGQAHNCTYVIDKERSGKRQQTEMDGRLQQNADDGEALDSDRMRDFAGLPEGMDSPRYRALGNAVTETVGEWIARRIVKYGIRVAEVRDAS